MKRHRSSRDQVRSYAEEGSFNHRILIVDDDPVVLDSLSDVLVSEGYSVVQARDGQEGVDMANRSEIDLVLLDLNMPVKNGWDAFEQLTREHPLLPVIVATARPNQLFTAVSAGAGALLEKPMDIPDLLQTIQQLLTESPEQRLARLAGRTTPFHYKPAGEEHDHSHSGEPRATPRPRSKRY